MNGRNGESAGQTPAPRPKSGSTSSAGRVLIVEDDRSLAELYARWLDDPYDVETVYDGETALDRLDGSVDVVLLDRRMHGRSGDEVLSEIRDTAVDCRVVMVSAVTPDLDIVAMGFDAYLQKPVDEGALRRTVDRMRTRATYDQKLQELFSLLEREDTLEAVKSAEALDASEEYQRLTDRLRTVQAEVESLLTDLSDEDFRVAVERLQRTAAERTDRRRYRSLTDDVLDSSREATVVVDADGTVVWANEATERLLGLDRETVGGRPYESVATEELEPVTVGDPDDGTSLADLVCEGLASRETELDTVVHVPGDDALNRPRRVLEYWSGPIETGLYAGGRIEHFHDITDRYTHERRLQTLHQATRELMTAETASEIADRAVTTASSALGFSYAAVYTREEATGALTLADRATKDDETPPRPASVSGHRPVSGGDGPVWSAFSAQSGALRASAYPDRAGDADNHLDDQFEDWLVCPLGKRGALVVAMAERSFSEGERNLAKTWAGNVRQALERFVRDRDLRERDRRLKRQNERLSVLNRINTLIRSIGPAVVNADSREAVESAVCDRLVELDLVTGVWVADVDIATGELVDRAVAGLDDYLEDVPTETDSATEPGPARRAYETGDPVVVEDLLSVDPGSWWRDRGLKRDSHTVFAVPVVHDGRRFGAIEVHIDRPRGVNDEEVGAVAELGTLVGHAIAAIRKRDALLSGGAVTLDFRVEREPTLSPLIDAVDVSLSVTDVSQTADAGCVLFVEADGGGDRDLAPVDPEVVLPDRDRDRGRDRDGVSVVRERPEAVVYRVTLADDSPIQELVDRGAALNRIGVDGDGVGLTVSVTLSHDVDVRDYVDVVTRGDVELVAKRDGPGDRQSWPGTVARLDDRLTDRQREALQVAFHAGYFDWPRGADGRSVADELGIAQSTFSQHLRAAEAKLLRELYG